MDDSSRALVWALRHATNGGYSVQPRRRGTWWASLHNGRTIGLFTSEGEAKADCQAHFTISQGRSLEDVD